MDSAANPWGAPASAAPPVVRLHDVMDEEYAAKLQREEEEQWERDLAAQVGRDKKLGWCFVEVASADREHGTVSVMEQEIVLDDVADDDMDADYALALELQAQEADEYDRLRRQEASSSERLEWFKLASPKRNQQLCSFVEPADARKARRSHGRHGHASGHGQHAAIGTSAAGYGAGYGYGYGYGQLQAQSAAQGFAAGPPIATSGRFSMKEEEDDAAVEDHEHGQTQTQGPSPAESAAVQAGATREADGGADEDDDEDELDEDDDLYLEDDCGLPIRKFNSLHLSMRSLPSLSSLEARQYRLELATQHC